MTSRLLSGDLPLLKGAYPIAIATNNTVSFNLNTTDSTSITTGSLVVPGGVGIGKTLFAKNINITATTDSTNSTTGALQVGGGVNIGKNLYIGGTIIMPYTLNQPYITLLRNDGQNLLQVFPVGTLSTSYVRLTAPSGSKGRIVVSNSVTDYWDMDSTGITTSSPFAITNTTDSTSSVTGSLTTSGGVGIAKSLKVGTTITCVSLTQTSDRNLKQDIEPLSDSSLNFILNLKPVSYRFKKHAKKAMGLIAQDVENACRTHGMPSSLVKVENGTYGLEYAQLIAPLINVVQKLHHSIDTLTERVENLEKIVSVCFAKHVE